MESLFVQRSSTTREAWERFRSFLTANSIHLQSTYQMIQFLEQAVDVLYAEQSIASHPNEGLKRKTYLGLGHFLCRMSKSEECHFKQTTFPSIIHHALALEKFFDSITRSRQYEVYDVCICYQMCLSVVACALLCVLPQSIESSILYSKLNLNSLYASVYSRETSAFNKLRSLYLYIDRCESSGTITGIRIRRRYLSRFRRESTQSGDLNEVQPFKYADALEKVRLPFAVVDRSRPIDVLCNTLNLPMAFLINSYLDGHFQSFGDNSLFPRYPDLLSTLLLCQRLGPAESVWVDHYRGPFCPIATTTPSERELQWRRVVFVNAGSFPTWASAAQFDSSYVISELINGVAAYTGVCTTATDLRSFKAPFDVDWCDFYLSKRPEGQPESASRDQSGQEPLDTNMSEQAANNMGNTVIQETLEILNTTTTDSSNHSLLSPQTSECPSTQGYFAHSEATSNLGDVSRTLDLLRQTDDTLFDTASRQSFSSIAESFSTSGPWQSSTRSSISQAHSLSTQSSLRRPSDLSSSEASNPSNSRAGEAPSTRLELGELHEHEAESDPSVHPDAEVNFIGMIPNGPSHRSPIRQLNGAADSREVPPNSESLVQEITNRFVSGVMDEACKLAAKRAAYMSRIANGFTRSGVRQALSYARKSKHMPGEHLIKTPDNRTSLGLSGGSSHKPRALPDSRFSRFGSLSSSSSSAGCVATIPTTVLSDPVHWLSPRKSSPAVLKCQIPNHSMNAGFDTGQSLHSSPLSSSKLSESVTREDSSPSPLPSTFHVSPVPRAGMQFSNRVVAESLIPSSRLLRFAECFATDCCVRALQQVRLKSSANPQDRRPPGLVLSGHLNGSTESTADPQLKIMLHWIAAAVAGSVADLPPRVDDTTELSDTQKPPPNEQNYDRSECYISPIVMSTFDEPTLDQLGTVLDRIYAARWTAGPLFRAILDYVSYRSCFDPNRSSNPATDSVLSLFDYLLSVLPSTNKCFAI